MNIYIYISTKPQALAVNQLRQSPKGHEMTQDLEVHRRAQVVRVGNEHVSVTCHGMGLGQPWRMTSRRIVMNMLWLNDHRLWNRCMHK